LTSISEAPRAMRFRSGFAHRMHFTAES
jgi:hypothetical protein